MKILSSYNYKELINIILLPIASYYFYLLAYLFLYGYYFHNEVFSFESLLFPIPFDFKALVFLGVGFIVVVIVCAIFLDRLMEYQKTIDPIKQFMNWIFFMSIFSFSLLGVGYYLFNVPIDKNIIEIHLVGMLLSTLFVQMRVKKIAILFHFIRAFIYSFIILIFFLLLGFTLNNIIYLVIILFNFCILIFSSGSIRNTYLRVMNNLTIACSVSMYFISSIEFNNKVIVFLAVIVILTTFLFILVGLKPKIISRLVRIETFSKLLLVVAKASEQIRKVVSKMAGMLSKVVGHFNKIYIEIPLLLLLILFLYSSYAYGNIIGSSKSYEINSRKYDFDTHSLNGYFIGSDDGIKYFSENGEIRMISEFFEMID